jgi:hypothetical protein
MDAAILERHLCKLIYKNDLYEACLYKSFFHIKIVLLKEIYKFVVDTVENI